MTQEEHVELGSHYRDTITGFEGVATSISTFILGCRRVQLTRMESGEIKEHYFDEPHLELLDRPAVEVAPAARTGGWRGGAPRTGS